MLILHACGTELPSRHTTNILLPDNADYWILTAWISLGKKFWGREEEREICLFSYFCTYMDGCFKQSYCLYLDKSRSTKFWCRCNKIQNKWVKVVRFRLERRLGQRKWGRRTANQRDKKTTNPTQPKTQHNTTQHREKGIIKHTNDAQSFFGVPTGSLALDHCSLSQDNEP